MFTYFTRSTFFDLVRSIFLSDVYKCLKMLTILMCFVFLSASPLLASVVKSTEDSCSPTEFPCGDGGCVSMDLVCDSSRDCADGSDELSCDRSLISLITDEPLIHRSRRQAAGACRKDQWRCRDGSCISFDGKCDGIVDCADRSDETHALCRNTVCQHNWFRCTYGACVDGTAPCNGEKECADESDELLPRCRNETEEIRGEFKCLDGTSIPATSHCDGTKDCPDGSDELVRTCGGKTCDSYLFQCAYGACVDRGADCNQVEECADGSDEAFDLCGTEPPTTTTKRPEGGCVLPPYPIHGTYVTNRPNAKPGDAFDFITINVTCRQGYGVDGFSSVYCYNGWWPEQIPKCVSQCRLKKHPSVEYYCLVFGSVEGVRICNEFEPTGTVVRPKCRSPNYYSPTSLPDMRCISGMWDYTARCSPGLTKNGTNVTILIKDTVEVLVSDIQYTVPIDINYLPVVPITDNDYNLNTISNDYEPETDHFFNNYYNSNKEEIQINEATETDIDESNSEIDSIDWRMGVPSIRHINAQYHTQNNNYYNQLNRNNSTQLNYSTERTHTQEVIKEYTSDDSANEDSYDINDFDWRMGVPSSNNNKKTQYNTQKKNNSTQTKNEITHYYKDGAKNNTFSSNINGTNIYFNISNSSVNIYSDDRLVKRN